MTETTITDYDAACMRLVNQSIDGLHVDNVDSPSLRNHLGRLAAAGMLVREPGEYGIGWTYYIPAEVVFDGNPAGVAVAARIARSGGRDALIAELTAAGHAPDVRKTLANGE